MSDGRQQTELAADRIRDDLLTTLRELDRRRLEATDLGYLFSRNRVAFIVVGSTVAAGIAAWIGVAVRRARNRRTHPLAQRVRGLRRAWEHPDRIASKADEAPLHIAVGRKVAFTLAIAVGTRLAQRVAERVIPRKQLDAVPAPGSHYN